MNRSTTAVPTRSSRLRIRAVSALAALGIGAAAFVAAAGATPQDSSWEGGHPKTATALPVSFGSAAQAARPADSSWE